MKEEKKRRKIFRVSKRATKTFLITSLSILFILIILNLILYANFKIGKDVLINVKADKEFVSVINEEPQDINFNIKVISNLFCRTICNSSFEDLSNNNKISNEQIILTSRAPLIKKYSVQIDSGEGLELYSYNIECKSIQTQWCHTQNTTYSRTIIIPVQHNLSSQEIRAKNYSEQSLKSILFITNEIISNQEKFNQITMELNKTIFAEDLIQQITKLNSQISLANSSVNRFIYLYNNQEYLLLEKEINSSKDARNLQRDFFLFNETITNATIDYNSILDSLNLSYNNLNNLIKANYTNSSTISEINLTISDFNSAYSIFSKRNNLSDKEYSVNNIKTVIDSLIIKAVNESSSNVPILFNNLTNISLNKIIINYAIPEEINLTESQPKCCISNTCNPCIKNSSSNYPVIFIHGHAFSQSIDVDYSLNAFDKIKKELANEGYIDAGSFSSYFSKETHEGILSNFDKPLEVKVSYYYDITQTSTEYIFNSDNNKNIDNYALRLKDVIEMVKIKSGKDKVIIVAHSMGGLVSRRYIQLFGEGEVDKLILIGTPNNGITGRIQKICSLTGGDNECKDMITNSTFMEKLNPQSFNIPVYMIVGQGCVMDYGNGDGVVLKENAILKGATNYYVNGTCNGLDLLHGNMLDPKQYPEVYNIIVKILKNEN
jgi:hypothetical protein